MTRSVNKRRPVSNKYFQSLSITQEYIAFAIHLQTGKELNKFYNFCLLYLLQGGRTTRLDRKESYKAQRRSYAKEKKRVERELLSTFKDQRDHS